MVVDDDFIAARLDIWQAANNTLRNVEWGEDYGKPCPADVLYLAHFLAGEYPG